MSAYGTINNISEDLISVRYLVLFSELNVLSFVHCEKCFLEVIILKYNDEDVEGLCLWCGSIIKDVFDGSLILFIKKYVSPIG